MNLFSLFWNLAFHLSFSFCHYFPFFSFQSYIATYRTWLILPHIVSRFHSLLRKASVLDKHLVNTLLRIFIYLFFTVHIWYIRIDLGIRNKIPALFLSQYVQTSCAITTYFYLLASLPQHFEISLSIFTVNSLVH